MVARLVTLPALLVASCINAAPHSSGAGVTSPYRRSLEMLPDRPLNADVSRTPVGFNAPEQVHITKGDQTGRAVIVSWVTPKEPGSNIVRYGTCADDLKFAAEGTVQRYTFRWYKSGHIHHGTLNDLKYDTKYYYAVGYMVTR